MRSPGGKRSRRVAPHTRGCGPGTIARFPGEEPDHLVMGVEPLCGVLHDDRSGGVDGGRVPTGAPVELLGSGPLSVQAGRRAPVDQGDGRRIVSGSPGSHGKHVMWACQGAIPEKPAPVPHLFPEGEAECLAPFRPTLVPGWAYAARDGVTEREVDAPTFRSRGRATLAGTVVRVTEGSVTDPGRTQEQT